MCKKIHIQTYIIQTCLYYIDTCLYPIQTKQNVHVFAWMCMYVIFTGTVLCLYYACMISVFCLYLACIFCSILYFQYDQVTDQWMLAAWLNHCSITNSLRSHCGRSAVTFRLHSCRWVASLSRSVAGRSFATWKRRLLDDFIRISSHSFSSGLWQERQWRHLLKALSKSCESMNWQNQTAVHHPTRSIELKLCTAQSIQTSKNQTWCTQHCWHPNNTPYWNIRWIGVRKNHCRSCQNER